MKNIIPPSLARRLRAFTLIELLTVMAIIAILAALILSISGYVNQKAAAARAQSEIQAISTALESYKTDNGVYPNQLLHGATSTSGTTPSDALDPRTMGNPATSQYQNASLELYEALTSDTNDNGYANSNGVPPSGTKIYLTNVKSDMLARVNTSAPVSSSNPVLYLSDPFGNSFGYSTANNYAVTSGSSGTTLPGYNPTFDLWSTGGQNGTPSQTTNGVRYDSKWIKNW